MSEGVAVIENRGEQVEHQNIITILDGGSQYGGLIDRMVREKGFRTRLVPVDTPFEEIEDSDAFILSGGPNSVYEDEAPDCDPRIFEGGIPTLGICYGMQLIAKHLGGEVGETALREDGPQTTTFWGSTELFKGLEGKEQTVLMSHGDSVTLEPPGFQVVGGMGSMISAIQSKDRNVYGVQFHPEVFQTECGDQLFGNFLHGIAGLESDYTIEDQEQEAIANIQEVVGEKDVIMFLSGGVDSTVLAALMAKAIEDKKRIHAVHIDTGFMREGESEAVITALAEAGIEVDLLNMTELFANATTIIDGVDTSPLHEVIDPQTKRKIIGDTFIKVRDQIIKELELGEDVVLAMGSLRPDLIESGSHLASTKADTIKTHHNDTEEVRKLREQGLVVEPLQAMYKDQVRELGRRLGLPEDLIARHPFPGPGLAIRIVGANVIPVELETYAEAQRQLDDLMAELGHGDMKAAVTPVKSVGVQGDGRSYKPFVDITGPAEWSRLTELARVIPNRVHGVNRVCYAFGEQEGLITLTPTHLEVDEIQQVRHADHIVTNILLEAGAMGDISQMPVVLLPVSYGGYGGRSVVLRPFISPDFMTGIAGVPGKGLMEEIVFEMARRIKSEVPGISRVLIDMSSKPPGTTEWE